jgi:hypothetical protein
MVSEEMVHGFSCKGNQSAFVVYMMGKRELFVNFPAKGLLKRINIV